MMRGSVSMLGSPLESPMILRPAARALRTRSVISTVAEGFRPRKRSVSGFGMSYFVLRLTAVQPNTRLCRRALRRTIPMRRADPDVAVHEVSHDPLVSPQAALH